MKQIRISLLAWCATVVSISAASDIPSLPTFDVVCKDYVAMQGMVLQSAQQMYEHIKSSWSKISLVGMPEKEAQEEVRKTFGEYLAGMQSVLQHMNATYGQIANVPTRVASPMAPTAQDEVIMSLLIAHHTLSDMQGHLTNLYMKCANDLGMISSCKAHDQVNWQALAELSSDCMAMAFKMVEVCAQTQSYGLVLPRLEWSTEATASAPAAAVPSKSAHARLFGK